MKTAQIGLIGLGVMGRNLALNMVDKGFKVAVFNRTAQTTDDVIAGSPEQRHGLIPCTSLEELVASLQPPRAILLMVKAGDAVDQQIAALTPLLAPGDILMDGGNANYRDSRRRDAALTEQGFRFLGVGVSGGEEGARHGPSIMSGGSPEAFTAVGQILRGIAAIADGQPCCAHLGLDGAGHFVKTLHNGIEYADMQMIAEIYQLMRHGLSLSADQIAGAFQHWNQGPLSSYLIEITGDIAATIDPDTNRPLVDVILDRAGEKGTGRWSAAEALELGAPAPTIAEAVAARGLSFLKQQRVAAAQQYGNLTPPESFATHGSSDTAATLAALESALLAGKVAAYAQGFAVIAAASSQYDWRLPLAEIARIWRAGCIIRSQFLDDIAAAFAADPDLPNLLVAPHFVTVMTARHGALRDTVARAALSGLPVPALASALAYFDSYRRERLSADLIQAQRDYFGAHTFERTDRDGHFHFDWSQHNRA